MSRATESTSHFALWAFAAWLAVTLMWWALAFAPLPVPADWLASARSVCFGSQPNGLPEPWGWAGLIVSPLAMLGFLLAVWGHELRQQLAMLAARPLGRVVLLVLALTPLVGAGWVIQRVARASEIDAAYEVSTLPTQLPEDYPCSRENAPALDLMDQRGEIVSLEAFRGRPVLLTFAFAHCRTVCPMVVRTLESAESQLEDVSPAVVVVTLDPWRDTPASLPTIYDEWGLADVRDGHVLSGPVDRVLEALDAWNMPFSRDPKTGDVSHPAMVHVLGPDGSLGYSFNAPPVDWVVEAARRLVAG